MSKRCRLMCRFCSDDEYSPLNVTLRVVLIVVTVLGSWLLSGVIAYVIELNYVEETKWGCVSNKWLCPVVGLAVMGSIGIIMAGCVLLREAYIHWNWEVAKVVLRVLMFAMAGFALQTYLLLPIIDFMPDERSGNDYCSKGSTGGCMLDFALNMLLDGVLVLVGLLLFSIVRYFRNKIREYNHQIDSIV